MAGVTAPPISVDDVLSALAEPTRLRIVEMLADEELCVCHLTEELGVGQPLVSHHLAVLRQAGIVEGQRHRYWTYYRLRLQAVRAIADHLAELGERRPKDRVRRRPCG